MNQTIETYKKNFEQFAKNYQNNTVERDQQDFLALLEAINGKKILDVGCGTGTHAQYFSQRNYDVTGIDLVEEFLEYARKRCGANFINMDLKKLNFETESFDGIWSCASLLHVPKHELIEVLSGFRKVLKPQGIIYASVKQGVGEKMENGRFFSYHTLESIESFLSDSGFKSLIKYTEEKSTGNWATIYSQKA